MIVVVIVVMEEVVVKQSTAISMVNPGLVTVALPDLDVRETYS